MNRHVSYCALGLLLCGCTSFEATRPDMHAHAVPSRIDELSMINQLNSAIELAAADGICITGSGVKAFRPKFVQGYRDFAEAEPTYSKCPKYRSLDPQKDKAKLRQYLDSGFGLVDLYCSRYFIIAAETRQSRQMQRNSASALDTLAETVARAAGLGANGLGIINHGFETADSTYKNIDAAFVIAPDRDDVKALVTSAQDKIRTEAYATSYASFAGARSAIDRYADACTFDGMRNLVGVAVRNAAKEARPGATPPTDGDDSGATPTPPTEGEKKTPVPATDRDLYGTATPG